MTRVPATEAEAEIDAILAEGLEEDARERRRRATPGMRSRSSEDARRGAPGALLESDLGLLRELVADSELSVSEAGAFDDMLRVAKRTREPLRRKQREWAERVARRVGITLGDPARRNEAVPRGGEVEPPAVLRADSVRSALEARERAKAKEREKRNGAF